MKFFINYLNYFYMMILNFFNNIFIFKIDNYNQILENPINYNLYSTKFDDLLLLSQDDNKLLWLFFKFLKVNGLENCKTFIVSLSGGVDSMVLLSILIKINIERIKNKLSEFKLIALHINYNLRSESIYEKTFLEKFCKKWNIIFHNKEINVNNSLLNNNRTSITVDGKVLKRQKFEELTKEIRFEFYRNICKKYDGYGVFLGHHMDDIIENIFTNSLKGHNIMDLEVIKSISNNKGIKILRPFLELNKQDILKYASDFKIPYFKDTTPKWSRRGKMRNEIFPLLDSVFNQSWRNKLKEIGEQSNNWNQTIDKVIIKPWMDTVVFSKTSFTLEIKFINDLNLWLYFLPILFHKIGSNSIKKRSITKLFGIISKKEHGLSLELDSGFKAYVFKCNVIITKDSKSMIIYNDMLKKKK